MSQAGVSGYELTQWYGLLAPARVPRPIVSALHAALLKAIADPDVRSRVHEQGGTMTSSSPEEFGLGIVSELNKAAQTIKAAGIKRD